MPSLLIGRKVTYSVTDSEGGKNYYQHTYGPEEDKKLHKKAMPRETDEESERSVPHHLSKDVRDRHIADRPVEETNSASSRISAHLIETNSLSQNIQLSTEEDGTPNEMENVVTNTDTNTNTNIPIQETDTMAPNTESLYPDILNSNNTKPDVISYVTHLSEPLLDGSPPNLSNRDFIVNSITGTIHSFLPESFTSSMATPNSNPSLALSGHACSEPVCENSNINPSMHSDVSVALLGVTSPEIQDSIKTETDQESSVSFSEINVNEGLGPHHMYRQVEHSPINSPPSPARSTRTEYLSATSETDFKTRSETDFKSIQSEYVSMDDTQSIGSSSPLSLYEEGVVLYPNYDYSALLHNTMSPQQQQQFNLDSDSDFSILMQNPSQQQQQKNLHHSQPSPSPTIKAPGKLVRAGRKCNPSTTINSLTLPSRPPTSARQIRWFGGYRHQTLSISHPINHSLVSCTTSN